MITTVHYNITHILPFITPKINQAGDTETSPIFTSHTSKLTHGPHNTEGFSGRCEKDWLGELAVDPRWGVGGQWQMTNYSTMCKKKNGKGEN